MSEALETEQRASRRPHIDADAAAGLWLDLLNVNDLPTRWDSVEPLVERACAASHGEFTSEIVLFYLGLFDGIERGKLFVLMREETPQAVMLVSIAQRIDGTRILECLLASGESARQWPAVDPVLDAYAADWGCSIIRVPCARKGWLKTLTHWAMRGYVLERAVGDGPA